MSDPSSFGKLVPGFDFLQNLVKNAGNALPGFGQWVAPTLDPAELDKRIGELRTVQYWLEQNGRMLATTIQALEVQKMTLTTLRAMNVPMADLTESLKVKSVRATPPAQAPAAPAAPERAAAGAARKEAAKAPAAIDPMQWWGALTNQFAQLATSAMKDSASDTAKAFAGGLAKQSRELVGAAKDKRASAPAPGAADADDSTVTAGERRSKTAPRAKRAAAKRPRAKPSAKRARNGASTS